MIYYHVSPTCNKRSILESGVDPSYSRGKLKCSWYVKQSEVIWAIAHVSMRHNVPVSEISVFAVDVCQCSMSKFASSNVFFSKKVGLALKETPASWYVEEK